MNYEIINLKISNELDIVLAYKRAKQLAEFTGMHLSTQTKFATAVSEICRNVLEHAEEGTIKYAIVEKDGDLFLEAVVTDQGRGIGNVEKVLNSLPLSANQKGTGIYNARKLVNHFDIKTSEGRGTKVIMQKNLPLKRPLINKKLVDKWVAHFENETAISPYEEIKKQNMELLNMMETLQNKNMEIEKQFEEIASLNNDLDQFAYTVSHDLKAPLKNIEALVSLLEESVRDKDYSELDSVCGMVNKQLIRMDMLIEEILSYSTLGKKQIDKQSVYIGGLVEEVVETITVPHGITITIQRDLPTLEIEAILLKQIFGNLIGNAIKYHDKKEGKVIIGGDMYNHGFYSFFVQDDGPGIPAIYQEKIFEIFELLPNSTLSSSGIGLSIVKKIIDEKGGKVWVESDGRGSKFIFTWPVE